VLRPRFENRSTNLLPIQRSQFQSRKMVLMFLLSPFQTRKDYKRAECVLKHYAITAYRHTSMQYGPRKCRVQWSDSPFGHLIPEPPAPLQQDFREGERFSRPTSYLPFGFTNWKVFKTTKIWIMVFWIGTYSDVVGKHYGLWHGVGMW
jgi:hypothetical protein